MSEVRPSKEGQIMDVGKGNDGDHPDDAVPTEIQLFRQFLQVEQARVEGLNRRNDIVERMIEANDASDERQYTYSLKRLESSERRDTQRMSFLGKAVWALGWVSTIILFFTIYAILWWRESIFVSTRFVDAYLCRCW